MDWFLGKGGNKRKYFMEAYLQGWKGYLPFHDKSGGTKILNNMKQKSNLP